MSGDLVHGPATDWLALTIIGSALVAMAIYVAIRIYERCRQ